MPRPPRAIALAALVLAALIAAAGVRAGTALTRDASLTVLTPDDGAGVGPDVLLAWERGGHQGRFAVDVDDAIPAPGQTVNPSPTVVITPGTALRLTFMPRDGGSPSARDWHRVAVIPIDADGRRVGEDLAVVHLRASSG